MPPSLLLGLAPDGVYPADSVARIAGALLPHRFTLTSKGPRTILRLAVYFLLHFPDPCGRWELPTIVSCGARTFL